jgi:hypothetical protein
MTKGNLYPGINPHLNSALQQRGGGWRSFHAYYLIMIADTLNEILPENYYAKPEDSLQVMTYDSDKSPDKDSSTADTLIYKTGTPARQREPGYSAQAATPTLRLPLPQFDEEEELTALIIYSTPENAVTRIELLSPANKRGGSHYHKYMDRRRETLLSGLRLVEIDFIHERAPVVTQIPVYSKRQKESLPYHILVSDPRADEFRGKTEVYSFGVIDKVKVVIIPLDDTDYIEVDFGEIYHRTVNKRPYQQMIDYTKHPVNFDAYSPEDQALILAHMAKIAEEQM